MFRTCVPIPCLLITILTPPVIGQDVDLAELKLEAWTQLYIADLDGGKIEKLFPEVEGRAEGSPSLSHDGTKLAFDAWNAASGERNTSSKIYLVDLKTKEETQLTPGAMPELSPGGHRIFYSRYDNRGVWVASVDNVDETEAKLDAKGWGTAWSPDGKKIAWGSYGREGHNLKIIDIIEGKEWEVFEGDKSPFRMIYFNFAWSPDSRNIVFKGVTHEQQTAIFAVEAFEEREPVLLLDNAKAYNSFAWHPDGSRIMLSLPHPETDQLTLYWMQPLKPDQEPVPIEKLPPQMLVTDPCLTPDGRQIIFSARIIKEDKPNDQVPKP